jgi:site-specific recombinase XerD
MQNFSGVFCKRVSAARVEKKFNRKYGLHSLRHTVATRMLENGVEFDKIAPFLGHSDESTLHVYLNSDIEHLRQCALSFEPEAIAV